jgi:hypothetical protein
MIDDGWDSVAGDSDQDQGEAEQEDEAELALHGYLGHEYYRDGEGDEEEIGNDIAGAHGDEVGVARATTRPGVRANLPVVVEGLALGQRCDDHGNQGRHEK